MFHISICTHTHAQRVKEWNRRIYALNHSSVNILETNATDSVCVLCGENRQITIFKSRKTNVCTPTHGTTCETIVFIGYKEANEEKCAYDIGPSTIERMIFMNIVWSCLEEGKKHCWMWKSKRFYQMSRLISCAINLVEFENHWLLDTKYIHFPDKIDTVPTF